jgi:putative ABC transport system permease protein
MMRPRWKKVTADLTEHVVRSLLVIASIAVGLFAIGMIITVYVAVRDDMANSYKMVNPANIQVRSAGFDQDFVDHIRNIPEVKEAEGQWTSGLRVLTAPTVWSQINLVASDDYNKKEIARLTVMEGKFPPAEHEIVIDKGKFTDLHVNLGDSIQIKTAAGDIRSFKVVGIVRDLTIGSSSGAGGFFVAPIQGYITTDAVEWLNLDKRFNQMLVTVKGDPNDSANIRKVSDIVLDEFDQNNITTNSSVNRLQIEHPTLTYVDAIAAILIVMGFLVLFLSGFLITNTLSALLNQQMQQIGVMKTVGGNRFQINTVYTVLILTYSLIALLISLPTSFFTAYWLLEYLAPKVNFVVLGHRFIPAAVIVQVVTALVVPQISGAVPIHRGTGISIREALTGSNNGQTMKDNFFYRLLTKIRGLTRPLLISLRNTFRQRVRLILTLTTLILGGATFISTFNARGSIDMYVDRIRKYFIADVNLTFNEPYRITRVEQDVRQIPGVVTVEGWASADAEILQKSDTPGESIQLLGPPIHSVLLEPTILQGRWVEEGDQNALVVNELFLKYYPNIRMGDTIRLRVNGEDKDWVVVGVFQFIGKTSGLMAYTDYEYLAKITHQSDKAFVFRIVSDMKNPTVEQQAELGRRIEVALGAKSYNIADVRAGKSLQKSVSDGLNILTTFLLIMAVLMAIVGSIGLTGTMSLNTMERTREIGIMRAIGASDKIITNMVLVEGMLIGTISCLLSMVFAIPITKLLADAISLAIFGSSSIFVYLPSGVIIWLILENVLAVLASVMPARNAARLTIREVLAYE